MKIETMLHGEIESEFEELKRMQVGSEEHKTAVESLNKLMDRAIEIDKLNIQHEDELKRQALEQEFKQKQLDDENKDRTVKNILTGLGIGLPLAVTIWGTVKSLEFEKEGTITTLMGRGFFSKLLPKK
jgi:hypothetical protein